MCTPIRTVSLLHSFWSPVQEEGRQDLEWVDARAAKGKSDTGYFIVSFYEKWTEKKHITI